MINYDVIVIGAGPVGLHTASRLASHGLNVLVLEKCLDIGEDICCSGILGKECWDRFPVSKDVVYQVANSARFYSPSGKHIRLYKNSPQAYIINRRAFDNYYADIARSQGVNILTGHNVTEVSIKTEGVIVKTGPPDRSEFISKLVVISNGFGSIFPRMLKMGNISDFAIGAQYEAKLNNVDEVEVYFGRDVAPGFFSWIVPTHDNFGLVGLLTRKNPDIYLNNFINYLQQEGKIASLESEIKFGGIALRTLPKSVADRAVVIGDAAGQVKPTTGGGIYYGLLSAEIAVEVIIDSFKTGNFSADYLSIYEKRWRSKLYRELSIDYYARSFFEKLNDSEINNIMDTICSNGIHSSLINRDDFSFDWHGDLIVKTLKHKALRILFSYVKNKLIPNSL